MFRALLCPSSGARDYDVVYHINANPSIFIERNDQCCKQHYSRELLMMGIVVPETC